MPRPFHAVLLNAAGLPLVVLLALAGSQGCTFTTNVASQVPVRDVTRELDPPVQAWRAYNGSVELLAEAAHGWDLYVLRTGGPGEAGMRLDVGGVPAA